MIMGSYLVPLIFGNSRFDMEMERKLLIRLLSLSSGKGLRRVFISLGRIRPTRLGSGISRAFVLFRSPTVGP